jgi:hypothetical protein
MAEKNGSLPPKVGEFTCMITLLGDVKSSLKKIEDTKHYLYEFQQGHSQSGSVKIFMVCLQV